LERRLTAFAADLRFAYQYLRPDAHSSLTKSRIVLEKLVRRIYTIEMGTEPRRPLLGDMLADNQFTRRIERRVLARMHAVRDIGNLGPHGERVEQVDAARALDDLCEVLDWYIVRYAEHVDAAMDPALPHRAGGSASPDVWRMTFQSAHDGSTIVVAARPSASLAWLVAAATKAIGLRVTADLGTMHPLRIDWIIVERSAEERWRARRGAVRARAVTVAADGELLITADENTTIADAGLRAGLVYHLHAAPWCTVKTHCWG
jgi:hypothetical protein